MERASGSIISQQVASQLKDEVGNLLREARQSQQPDAPAQSGYAALRVSTGDKHAPRYTIDVTQLKFLRSLCFNAKQIAAMLGVSSSTVHRRMK